MEIGEFLKQNTTPNDKVAILGSEPQILFYANRYSVTGHIYAYNLVEDQPYALTMQRQVVFAIEQARPKYIIYVNIDTSWLLRPNSVSYIFEWADKYIENNYTLAGLVNVVPNEVSTLVTGEQLINFQPLSREMIFIYERNNTLHPAL
jgi:hypothetical protein